MLGRLPAKALVGVNPQQARPVCATCGATNLEHFYTSKRKGRTLCAACFEQRVERGLAWEWRIMRKRYR